MRAETGRPEGTYWFILQTYTAARGAYRRLLRMLRHSGRMLHKSETELLIVLQNGASIFFKSGHSFEDLRSETLDGVVIDEMRQQHPDLWPLIIYPMLARFGAWAVVLSTPNGFDHFFDLFDEAQIDQSGAWEAFYAPSTDAWWWGPENVLHARKNMSDRQFQQEILAQFVDLMKGKAYVSYGPHNEREDSPFAPGHLMSPHLPVLVGTDFNITPMHWTMGQYRGNDFHFHDEIHLEGPYQDSPTKVAADVLVQKIRELPFSVNDVGGLVICGDATGKATQRTSNESDYSVLFDVLRRAGIRYANRTPLSNPAVKDRVTTVNARLRDATGRVHVTLNHKACVHTRKDFQRTTWKDGSDFVLDPGPKKENTHATDSVGYPIFALAPLPKLQPVGTLKVITR